jgi:hypothetical protein
MSIQVTPAIHLRRRLQALIEDCRDVGAMLNAVNNNLNEHSQGLIIKLLAIGFFNDMIGGEDTLSHIQQRLADLNGIGSHFGQTWPSLPFEKWLWKAAG